jgi:transglutaminase-like putative cysteine protease
MSELAGSSEFRERARLEANRYGPDPWVFVRELLQNARDAGATHAIFEIEETDGLTRIRCVDDGEGMGFDHARRYLFSLYASSKEDEQNQVGRFGVGFWSVLRFDPSRILIRSRPRGEEAWEIALDGSLEHAERRTPDMQPGTEVVLEKAFSDGAQTRRVRDAASQNARFLCQRDARRSPLEIIVNGERINAAFQLAAPSASFRRGAVRGVVGLGAAPRVELFSRGLRVRAAACLDDLLSSSGHTSHSRVRFPELPGAMTPQALLESDGLELLLSRSDARENRSLRKLVRLANRELERLVDRQLDQVRPPGLLERLTEFRRRLIGDSLAPRVAVAVFGGIALAVLASRLLWGPLDPTTSVDPTLPVLGAPPTGTADASGAYGDLASRYRGPQVSELDPSTHESAVPLTYTPQTERPYFAALVVSDLDGGAAAPATGSDGVHLRYRSSPCKTTCLSMHLKMLAASGTVRIPVPTGHRLDVESVRLNGQPVRVYRTTNDEPILHLDSPAESSLEYRTGPALSPDAVVPRLAVGLPTDLLRETEALRRRPTEERVTTLLGIVMARVGYSTSREVAALHHEAISRGDDFIPRTLAIGAGDCDVQNGLLVALLQAAEVPARLAVGYVGQRGEVAPWLHAWAEYRDEEGLWRAADASSSPFATGDEAIIVAPDATAPSVAVGPGPAEIPSTAASPDPAKAEPSPATEASSIEAAAAPAATAETARPSTDGSKRSSLLVAAGIAGLLGALLLVLGLRRRTKRSFRLDESGDLSRLLHGALQRPAAFRHLPALFYRRLIPLAGGRALSLNRARDLAARGRLFRSRDKEQLAARAVKRRVDVLDDESPEARTVGDTLGATDLDRWSRLLDRARNLPILAQINAYLHELGARWEVLAVEGAGESVASLDLRALRLGRANRRVVLIDEQDPWLVEASQRLADHPATATLLLLDHLLERLDISPERRAELLTQQARAALREASG